MMFYKLLQLANNLIFSFIHDIDFFDIVDAHHVDLCYHVISLVKLLLPNVADDLIASSIVSFDFVDHSHLCDHFEMMWCYRFEPGHEEWGLHYLLQSS